MWVRDSVGCSYTHTGAAYAEPSMPGQEVSNYYAFTIEILKQTAEGCILSSIYLPLLKPYWKKALKEYHCSTSGMCVLR